MTSFLQNLITIARQERPVLRPRPVNLFEGMAPADIQADNPQETTRPSPARSSRADAVAPSPTLATKAVHTAPPEPPRASRQPHALVQQEAPAAAASAAVPAAQPTVIQLIREVQTVAPAPSPQNIVAQPASEAEVKPARKAQQTETTAQPAAHPPRPTTAAKQSQSAPLSRFTTPPAETTNPVTAVVHHRHTEEHHHSRERVMVEKSVAATAPSSERQAQSRNTTSRPAPTTHATPIIPQTSSRSVPLSRPLPTAREENRPTVNVSIGTVEIQAVSSSRPATLRPRVVTPQPLSLDDYLQQRSGESFE